MSDEHPMSAPRARDLARHYQAFASQLRQLGVDSAAEQAERDAKRWLTYADRIEGRDRIDD